MLQSSSEINIQGSRRAASSTDEQEGRERATIHSSGMRPTHTACSEQEGRERATIHSSGMRPTLPRVVSRREERELPYTVVV